MLWSLSQLWINFVWYSIINVLKCSQTLQLGLRTTALDEWSTSGLSKGLQSKYTTVLVNKYTVCRR